MFKDLKGGDEGMMVAEENRRNIRLPFLGDVTPPSSKLVSNRDRERYSIPGNQWQTA